MNISLSSNMYHLSSFSCSNYKNRVQENDNKNQSVNLAQIPHYRPAFSGALNKNLNVARDVIKEFGEEFPLIKSNTKIGSYIDKHEFEPQYRIIVKKLKSIEKQYSKGVEQTRNVMDDYELFDDINGYKLFIDKLSKSVKDTGFANCNECSQLSQSMLFKRGVVANNVLLDIKYQFSDRDKLRGSHIFNVIGLKPGEILTEPTSWNDNAVVVDPLFKLTIPAKNALSLYKKMFGFDPEMYNLTYHNANLMPDLMIGKIINDFQ